MSRQNILKKLTLDFNSGKNIKYIINEVFDIIAEELNVKVLEDSYFENVFNDISNKIYDVESERQQLLSLYQLNDIIIKHLSQYIINNIQDFETKKVSNLLSSKIFEEEPRKIKPKVRKIQNEPDVAIKPKIKETIKEEFKRKAEAKPELELNNEILKTLTLDLTEIDTMVNLNNVKSITLKTIDIINSDYIINEFNNYLIIKVVLQNEPKLLYYPDQKIIIPEGNYTNNQLVDIIEILLNKEINTNVLNETDLDQIPEFKVSLNELTDKICISCNILFELSKTELMDILGLEINKVLAENVSSKPLFLTKRRTLPLGISINNTEPIIQEMFYLETPRTLLQLSSTQIYKSGISIDNIFLDFGNYNFRDTPFFVKLEIKYIA
jgi:hypothetical protein